jgi:hypothetical protein
MAGVKKYLNKFSTPSSTAKFFFFIGILLVIVLLASSGFYIQYKKGQKQVLAAPSQAIDTQSNPRAAVDTIPVTDSGTTASENTTVQSPATVAPATITAQTTGSVGSCTKQILRPKAVYKDAPWLFLGETRVVAGKDGYLESCPGKRDITVNPIDQIIYRGIQPLSEVTSLIDSAAEGLLGIKI